MEAGKSVGHLPIAGCCFFWWDFPWPFRSSPWDCGRCLRSFVPVLTSLGRVGSPEAPAGLWWLR